MENSMSMRLSGSKLRKNTIEDDIVRRGWSVAFGMALLGIGILFVLALGSIILF
ncbi:MAG: hypothetical protein ABFC94_16040 [Syntrophomonas sp.]